ncbi:MAG TPA: HPr family phosphocarrier protein [Opitutus sp.]|nr:HPr family phosphocarrier protein [Opitutus sp.]
MKNSRVVVLWRNGLHLRQAAALVRAAEAFRSTIHLKCGGRVANLRSILSVVALCATMGMTIDVEVSGDDEQDATVAIEQVFSTHDAGDTATDVVRKKS